MVTDDFEEFQRNLSICSPHHPTPPANYFIPLNLLQLNDKNDSKEILSNNVERRNTDEIEENSCDILQLIGSPGAIIIDVPKRQRKEQKPVSKYFMKDKLKKLDKVKNNKLLTSLNVLTDGGIKEMDENSNVSMIESTSACEFSGIAMRAGILVVSSSNSKKCSFFNLNISVENNSIQENIRPTIYETELKDNCRITSFSVSDIGIKLFSTKKHEKLKEKEKSKEKDEEKVKNVFSSQSTISNCDGINQNFENFLLKNNRLSSATFHPKIPIFTENNNNKNEDKNKDLKNNDLIIGQNAILFLGDSNGIIHYCIVNKSIILKSGFFNAHTAPIVSVLTTGEI